MASDNSAKNSVLIQRLNLAKNQRGFRNMSEVADNAGVKRPTVTGWKKGAMPTDKNIEAMAATLGVSTEWLLGTDNAEPNWNCSAPNLKEAIPAYQARGFEALPTEALKACLQLLVDQEEWAGVEAMAAELKLRENKT